MVPYPPPMIALWGHWSSVSIGWPIGAMDSCVWTPMKEDPEKGIGRLKAGSADRRLEALATFFATTTALPKVLNLTVPSNINWLKTDSRLIVITSQLITSYTELKHLVVVIHDIFNHCIMNKCCYLQLLTSYWSSWPANITGKDGCFSTLPEPREVQIITSTTFPWVKQCNVDTEIWTSRSTRNFDL